MDDKPAPCATFAFTPGGHKKPSGSGAEYGLLREDDKRLLTLPGQPVYCI